jgi:hypothetical protein
VIAALVGTAPTADDPSLVVFAAAFAAAAGLWVWIAVALRLMGRLRRRA